MKILMMLVVTLLVLGGGGGGAYYYFTQNADAMVGPEIEEVKEEVVVQKAPNPELFRLVDLDPMILPIVDNNGVSQTVSVIVSVEAYDEFAASEVRQMKPRLTSEYLKSIYVVLNQHAATKGGVFKVNKLRKRLNALSQKMAGEDVIHDVVVQVVQQRPV